MKEKEIIDLLNSNDLSVTQLRVSILKVILNGSFISQKEIKKKIDLDRVTLYRNLTKLIDEGIIQRVEVHNELYFGQGKPDSLYFYCLKCKKVYSLGPATFKLPAGFVKASTNLVIEGYCKNCLNK